MRHFIKKSVVSLITLMLITTSIFGCNRNAENNKQTIEIFINVPITTVSCAADESVTRTSDFIEKAFNKFAESYTKYNVELKYGCVENFAGSDFDANITENYGTENCPDLTFGGYFDLSGYVYEGNVIPLDDIITNEMLEDISESAWSLSKAANGKTYLLPFYSEQKILCYDKALFRNCGLYDYISDEAVIQSWTTEEWATILNALATWLPDNTYPMMMYAENPSDDIDTMLDFLNCGTELFDESGLLNFETESCISGLQSILENYNSGYYPKNCENLDFADNTALFLNGQIAIYLWDVALEDALEDRDIGYVNFPGAGSNGTNTCCLNCFMAFDNGDEKKIEVVKDFLKFIYENSETMDFSTCGLPCSKAVKNRWLDKTILGEELEKNEKYSDCTMQNNPNWKQVSEAFWPHFQNMLKGKETPEEAAAGIDADFNTAILSKKIRLHE